MINSNKYLYKIHVLRNQILQLMIILMKNKFIISVNLIVFEVVLEMLLLQITLVFEENMQEQ